jgi:(1->4)-alpha-D-glucan 1-alpha-D-glucosylmutase
VTAPLQGQRDEPGSHQAGEPNGRGPGHVPPSVSHPHVPVSTYRIQLNQRCTFLDAARIVPYLHSLGITDLYCSPYFTAVPGSPHGYDVVDPTALNPELGTEEDYRTLVEALRRHGMGQLLDVVSNHMGVARQINGWWRDVLENGPSSRYASFFDIDWNPLKPELRNKVLLPILGDQYGTVLENQELRLCYESGAFSIRYYDHRLPVAPKTWALILGHRLPSLVQELGTEDPALMELQSIMTALKHLPSRLEQDPELVAERYREKGITARRLSTLMESSETIRTFVEENVRLINGDKDDPRSFDTLDAILNDQAYRVAYWRVASEEINYRRFFDINELAAIRMEDPAVFHETHRLLFRLMKEGAVTGLRIDHVDGLYDPADYLNKLQRWADAELRIGLPEVEHPLYVVVEKILGVSEELPANWPVYGTTGYDFLSWINQLFIDRSNERAFDAIYSRFTGKHESFEEMTCHCKQVIMQASMAGELNVLGYQLNRLSERNRRSRDFTLNSLTHAIQEIIACFPVYRTYITGGTGEMPARDRSFIWEAVSKAKRRNPTMSGLVFDFVRDLLLAPRDRDQVVGEERLRFVTKFQQTTSPVAAKGIEDTAFYRFHRFIALNEVGSDPRQFGITPGLMHDHLKVRQHRWSGSLSATATHDTKRGEDMRARLHVLSEMPKQWKDHVLRWHKLNRGFKRKVGGESVPGRNEEYLFYQTLVGAWPFEPMDEDGYRTFVERIQRYMNKAVKEAKQYTSWISPDVEYEEAVQEFVARVLDRATSNPFLDDFLPFQSVVAGYGVYNSLSQLLVKVTAPGVPDFYQGTELWDFSLVDPDNRRPVDFAKRIDLLAELDQRADGEADRLALVRDLMAHRADGRIKFYLTAQALRYRIAHAPIFQEGEYVKLECLGVHANRLFAFARLHPEGTVLTVIPRLLVGLIADSRIPPLGETVWGETWVVVPAWREGTKFRNVFTGERLKTITQSERQVLSAGEVFLHCPVACLEKEG